MALYLGLMSGTSVDGVDAALVELDEIRPRLVMAQTYPYPPALRDALLAVGQGEALPLAALGELDTQVGETFAACAAAVMAEAHVTAREVRAIGSHGQTVAHAPHPPHPYTLQIGDPNIIAERTRITTVADFRRRDVAAGGQGAPLAPAFHAALFGGGNEPRVVVNIGGIANVTLLPADQDVVGFDTGPGNCLMDAWATQRLGRAYDAGGEWARSGHVHTGLLDTLLADDYFRRSPPKSTGRDFFQGRWLAERLKRFTSRIEAPDVQATLAELTARTISEAISAALPQAKRVLVCGGGAYNHHLMERLQAHLACATVTSTAAYGLAPEWVEAVAFAWLAKQTLEGRPGNLPRVTGARRPLVLGAIYPG